MRKLTLPLFLALIWSCTAPRPPADDVGLLATVQRETLTLPIALAGPEIGELFDPVTTASPAARRYYEQGLTYLASFDWVRAARSFNESLRRDSQLAAAHLGLGRAYLGLESAADASWHIQEAERLTASAGLGGWQQGWIELGGRQIKAIEAWNRGSSREHGEYLQAIERYIKLYPESVPALILRGNADPRPDAWGQAGQEGALPWYKRALELDADHLAAHHFLAHAHENSGHHAKARRHAERYASLAPGVPHAHHMVAHVLPRLGEWDKALDHLEQAHRLHLASFEAGDSSPRSDWHYGHNLRLLGAVHLNLGHEDAAERAYRASFELPYSGRRAGFYCVPWLEYLLSRQRFDEALEAADSCGQRDSRLARVLAATFRGEALVGLGRLDEAQAAWSKALKRQRELMADPRATSSEPTFVKTARLAVQTLEGKLALGGTRQEEGESLLLGVTDNLARGESFDAWAYGHLRIEEIGCHASRSGHTELASSAEQRRDRLEKTSDAPGSEAPR